MMAAETTSRTLNAGTRGSELARTQTEEVLSRLRRVCPQVQFQVQIVRTHGDRDRLTPLSVIGGNGVFVKELEEALLSGAIDLAVHSLKDLPPVLTAGLQLAAICVRADPRDALVSRERLPLASLPEHARVGTSSARRRVQIAQLRPDLQVVDVRGNVDTRIRKVESGEVDAVVLAAAGLSRLGRLAEAAEIFSPDQMVPSPGQGALAVEVRADDAFTVSAVGAIDDPPSRRCVEAERAFLERLGAGCTMPAGAYAAFDVAELLLWGMLAQEDGSNVRTSQLRGPADQAVALGRRLAESLLIAPPSVQGRGFGG